MLNHLNDVLGLLIKESGVHCWTDAFTHNWNAINRIHAHSGPWRTVDPWDGVEGLTDVDVEIGRLVPVYIIVDSCVVTGEMD